MAEIKSTMDLVMERAARIGKASSEEVRQEEAHRKGIQFAVEFMEGKSEEMLAKIQEQEKVCQIPVMKGIGETLLRNITLPRDEVQQERAKKAVEGLQKLDGGSGIGAICSEIGKILDGYLQHREQLKGQLEEQIKLHYEQLMAQQAQMQQAGMPIDQLQQPKFQEEWNRVETELNSQYGNALDQLKLQISQRLGIV